MTVLLMDPSMVMAASSPVCRTLPPVQGPDSCAPPIAPHRLAAVVVYLVARADGAAICLE